MLAGDTRFSGSLLSLDFCSLGGPGGGRHPRCVHGVEWQDVLAWKTQLPLR